MALDPPHWNLNPEKFKKSFTERTKAIVLNRLETSTKNKVQIVLILGIFLFLCSNA